MGTVHGGALGSEGATGKLRERDNASTGPGAPAIASGHREPEGTSRTLPRGPQPSLGPGREPASVC